MFFYKEWKRMQRLEHSFIKNGKERKDCSFLLKRTEKNTKIEMFFWKERMPNRDKVKVIIHVLNLFTCSKKIDSFSLVQVLKRLREKNKVKKVQRCTWIKGNWWNIPGWNSQYLSGGERRKSRINLWSMFAFFMTQWCTWSKQKNFSLETFVSSHFKLLFLYSFTVKKS